MPETEPTPETIGQRIRRLRNAVPLTQRELAEQSGVPEATIKDIELKPRRPHNSTLRPLAQVLGVTAAYLLSGDDPKQTDVAHKVEEGYGSGMKTGRGDS